MTLNLSVSPYNVLSRLDVSAFDYCRNIFVHHVYYNAEKLFHDVPEFQPRIGLAEGMKHVIEALDRDRRLPNSNEEAWEDGLIGGHRSAVLEAGFTPGR